MFGLGAPEFVILLFLFSIVAIPIGIRKFSLKLAKHYTEEAGSTDEYLTQKNMTDSQRLLFQSEMGKVRKNRTTGLLLALFLGGFGAHHYYTGSIGKGVVYSVFVWTFIPTLLALIDCFYIMNYIDYLNSKNIKLISTRILEDDQGVAQSGSNSKKVKCPHCAEYIQSEATICHFCKEKIQKDISSKSNYPTKDIDSIKNLIKQGQEAIKTSNFNDAIIFLTRAIDLDTNNAESFYCRAVAYSKLNDKQKTMNDIKQAAKLGHKKAIKYLANQN